MPVGRYRRFADEVEPDRAARPHLARHGHRPRTAVVRGRPARRQPGADRPDEPGPQAAHVRPAGPHGLQGDRGRLPVGQPDRLRLRPRDHRARAPIPDDVTIQVLTQCRPELIERTFEALRGRAAGDRALLQLDVDPAAPRRVPRRPRRHQEHRHRRRAQVRRGGSEVSRAPTVALRVLARSPTPAPSWSTPSRSATRSPTSSSRRPSGR